MSEAVRSERQGDVAVIVIDNPPVNAASAAVRQGLLRAIETFESDPQLRAAIIRCDGRTFVAGADIREFRKPAEPPRLGDLCDRIEACSKPVVAALHGTALGGGLELALACHARVALTSATLGLPEVKLGLIPGAGGTQRLPRLIGVHAALRLMLSGDSTSADDALQCGLVDQVVTDDAAAAAMALALQLAATGTLRRSGGLAVAGAPLDEQSARAWRREAAQRARGQRAPGRIAEAVIAAAGMPIAEGLVAERRLFEESRADAQSAALRHLFFAERAAGKVDATPLPVNRAGVIGAGTMGTGIAIALADAGIAVVLVDTDPASLERGRERVASHYRKLMSRGRLTADEAGLRAGRIVPASDLAAAASCDLVVEAVFENLGVKQAVFAQLDVLLPGHALLSTNTSYLDVDRIAASTRRPGQVLGLHFFSPANVMKLVEVVRAAATSEPALATGAALARRLGKIPVIVGNASGFVGNRMLQAYGRENQLLLLEGATPWQVDAALESWGMAMGPNAVLDLAGLDIGYRARRERRDVPDDPRYFRVADALVESGRLGQKSGRGNYVYAEGGSRQPDPDVEALIVAESARFGITRRVIADAEIIERCILALINEGAALLRAGVASQSSDIDVIWANGYGFPRHRGGPMWHADALGLRAVLERIEELAHRHGTRYWDPAPRLVQLARSGARFSDT
jgi:3-hydroxyacyl-CoA dehydrogenase